jgi:hypothetical protein
MQDTQNTARGRLWWTPPSKLKAVQGFGGETGPGEPGSFELVETPPRLKRLLRKKVGTETTPRPITAAAMPPHSMRGQLFCCPHFLPAVAVSTGNYQQLLAPPVPRSRCND